MFQDRELALEFKSTSNMRTSRERHKSAAYLRLKNSKRTKKCQVFFTVPEKPKSWTELARQGTLSDFFYLHCCKTSKN